MRAVFRSLPALALLLAPACKESVFVDEPSTPQNLTYKLEPSGDPDRPAGIILSWDDVTDPDLESYHVYSRGTTAQSFGLRGVTTSNTFHDNGVPHLEYFVTAVNTAGGESPGSNVVQIDEFLILERPASIGSISLNRAVHVFWADNAFLTNPNEFEWYRIYSVAYDRLQNLCDIDWVLEGTTVAPEFLVASIPNGVARCYAVSAVSRKGYESLWSPLWHDTPRFDARNVIAFAYDDSVEASGFRFWQDLNANGTLEDAELGLVVHGDRTDIDFWVFRDPVDSTLWFQPEFSGTTMQVYGAVGDLTEIDVAPSGGYDASQSAVEMVPGYGYVFRIVEGTTVRFGAIRVTHVSRRYVLFDWSFQSDSGNPELVAHAGMATVTSTGGGVSGSK